MARNDGRAKGDGSPPPSPSDVRPAQVSPAEVSSTEAASAGAGSPRSSQRADDPSPEWTTAELAAIRRQLTDEVEHLSAEISTIDDRVADLIHDSGDGAGDDQAESGSKAFEREHEQTLANIARDAIGQARHALQRIDDSTYGTCESCGRPIAKPRLQAYPRATLCVECKQREEHH